MSDQGEVKVFKDPIELLAHLKADSGNGYLMAEVEVTKEDDGTYTTVIAGVTENHPNAQATGQVLLKRFISPPDQQLYDDITDEATKRFTELSIQGGEIHNYFLYPYPQRLHILREMLRIYVLREVGNYRMFITETYKINALCGHTAQPYDDCLLKMCEWLRDTVDGLKDYQRSTDKPRIVLSMLAWGSSYIERVRSGCLQSWLSAGNIAELYKTRDATLYIHTDVEGRKLFESSSEIQRLKYAGLIVDYAIIPKEIIEYMRYIREEIWDPSSKFWLVGASAALGITYANKQGAGYHQVIPDAVYSQDFFKEVVRLADDEHHEVILQQSIRTDSDVMTKALSPYRKEGVLTIPSTDLVSLALNSIHLSAFNQIVNNRVLAGAGSEELLPDYHLLYWESNEALHIHTPHLDMVYLAASRAQNVPDRFFMSFDSEIDLVVGKEDTFYITQKDDYLFKAEMTPPQNYGVVDTYVSIDNFCETFWKAVAWRDMLKFFARGVTIRFNPELRKPLNPQLAEVQINREIGWVTDALRLTKAQMGDLPEQKEESSKETVAA